MTYPLTRGLNGFVFAIPSHETNAVVARIKGRAAAVKGKVAARRGARVTVRAAKSSPKR